MSDISVLEGRLHAALDRIGRALESPSPESTPVAPVDDTMVQALESRVQELQSALSEAEASYELESTALSEKLSKTQEELSSAREQVNALREELQAAEALRKRDQEELAQILSELDAVVGEQKDA